MDKKFPSFNLRPFFAGFIVVFLMAFLSQFGIKLPEYHFFQPKKENAIHSLRQKLEDNTERFKLLKKGNNFLLTSFITSSYNQASSYIVIDFETGEVLAEKERSRKLPVASLTKVMTSVISLDLAAPSDLFEVSVSAANQEPTKIGVVAGQKMTVKELLNAVLLTSANDAAQVIKEGIDKKYGKGSFIKAMNIKAESLGLKGTKFSNPQGFDSRNNYSTSEDMAILSHYALTKYPLISEIARKDYQFLPADNNHKQFDLYNWNGLLGVYPGVLGLKIGNTGSAGYTNIVVSERQGKKILIVLLGASGVLERDLWSASLLDTGFKVMGFEPIGVTEGQLREKYGTWRYF